MPKYLLRYFAIAFQIQILAACRSSNSIVDPPSSAGYDSAADGREEDGAPPPPAASSASDAAALPAAPTRVDLSDPAAAAACSEIAMRPPGTFAADAPFEVAGAKTVAADFDDVKRLALAFDWPAKRVRDGNTVWRYDARLGLALELMEPNADRTFSASTTPYAVRVWKYEKKERACTTLEIDHEKSFRGAPMAGAATLLVTKRSDTEIEGAITLKDDKGVESKLSFRAPLAVSLENDTTVCCLASLGGG